jgi:hypothetical protein|tara:strand:- start:40 stop:156 length:117 start_codon:yes stop_codon:yes gene_type:complete
MVMLQIKLMRATPENELLLKKLKKTETIPFPWQTDWIK